MGIARPPLAPTAWPRLPRRTARLRLTALCGGLFLVSGVALVAFTYVLFQHATQYRPPRLPTVPHTSSVGQLQIPGLIEKGQTQGFPVAQGPAQPLTLHSRALAKAQQELGFAQDELGQSGPRQLMVPLARIQSQLARARHQLAAGQSELASAVHQLAQAGSAQAAQRAADSHQLLVDSAIALGVVAVLAILAGWLVAGRMLRPIRTITRTARRISSTSLHERLALDGPDDELKELGDTLDGLFTRLEAAFEAQRHFVANASHELRTPLTAERALLQVALDDPETTIAAWRSTAEEVLASSDEHARLIEALLTLASSESELNDHEPVDLAAAVTTTLVDLQPEIDRVGLRIDAATAPAPLAGDSLLVERLVANLLTNAVRHNIIDGRVEVVTGVQGGGAFLSVTNTGPLIPSAEIDRLFQPFQRLDRRRTHHNEGHGLGLSIVRAIAAAHQATISADSLPDGGLAVSVTFPQAQNPRPLAMAGSASPGNNGPWV